MASGSALLVPQRQLVPHRVPCGAWIAACLAIVDSFYNDMTFNVCNSVATIQLDKTEHDAVLDEVCGNTCRQGANDFPLAMVI